MEFLSNPELLLSTLGPWVIPGVALILFIESGALFPFLPGDSLIFVAAMLHVQFGFSIWTLVVVSILAAFFGVQFGYFLGARWGRGFFKDDARILKTEYLHRTEEFFDKYGAPSLVLSRFVPIVRTFVPIVAGAARMNYKTFIIYNGIAAVAWVGLMTLAGVFLGQFDVVANNIDVIAILIVLISVMPIVIAYLRKRFSSSRPATDDEAE